MTGVRPRSLLATYRVRLDGHEYDVCAAGPGLGPETVMQEVVRRHYVRLGAVQARFVRVLSIKRVGRTRYLVKTSRDESFVASVKRWTMGSAPDDLGTGDHP